jgi:LL-diaminopimelate aminotransferase
MQLSSRLDRLPPYLWAEMDRKIREKKAAGVDVISLGIGDPDIPTPEAIVSSLAEAAANPSTHNYPSNLGTQGLREAFARFYGRRFGVELDPETEVIPALGSKECIYNLNSAFLDPGSVALASDPGYPVYTGGPLLVGAEAELMPLLPELDFAPDFDAIDADVARRARLMFLNYPNNPTGAVAPDGLFERAVEFGREHDVLIVHDASYTETTYDGYVAPSFLETPGAKDVGVEVFSLSKGWNMTGWRTAAIVGNQEAVQAYWRLKTNIDSGVFEAIQRATITALDAGPPPEMLEIYKRRRDMVCRALAEIGVDVTPPRASIYIWAPVPEGHTSASYSELVLDESGVVVSPGSAFGPNGEGFFRISLTVPDDRLAEAVERLRGSLGG